MKPVIALTMGDPAGVGPEICLTALSDRHVSAFCTPVVFGDVTVLQKCANTLNRPLTAATLADAHAVEKVTVPSILDLNAIAPNDFVPGQVSAATGKASFEYIRRAIDAVIDGRVSAVTTAPISKEALALAGIPFPGHTEIFAERCGCARFCMMQYSPEITCTFVTVHVGYGDVPALLSVDRIVEVIHLTVDAMRQLHQKQQPQIVVCGLNPHAGEHGLFGDREEERFIVPAIEHCRNEGILVEGPLPPDTAFLPWRRKTTDAFVCMYHDQGHIPVKALAFESAVNTTLGLPVVRTSVDHGTACDIAWQGKAMPDSLFAALKVATDLSAQPDT
jgi:4-hydroxythreonine-4-phosphate dehydrogenase